MLSILQGEGEQGDSTRLALGGRAPPKLQTYLVTGAQRTKRDVRRATAAWFVALGTNARDGDLVA